MKLNALIFPRESRHFPGKRWTNILLRTLHLIGLAGLGAGFLYPDGSDAWRVYWLLTLYSGFGLMGISIWSNGIWMVQLRGQAILLKILLLFLIPIWPETQFGLFLVVIVISGLIAHAPANVRYHSLFHGRRVESLSSGSDIRDKAP